MTQLDFLVTDVLQWRTHIEVDLDEWRDLIGSDLDPETVTEAMVRAYVDFSHAFLPEDQILIDAHIWTVTDDEEGDPE